MPWAVAAVIAAWVMADAAAALGVRRLVIGRQPVLVAWLLGWADLARRPLSHVIATAAFGLAVLVVLAGPAMLAAAAGWGSVRDVMTHGSDPAGVLLTVAIWVAVWLGGPRPRRGRPRDPRGRLDARGHAEPRIG